MVTATLRTTDTNSQSMPRAKLQLTDTQRIARSLQRSTIATKYSHGTVKSSAMAMINLYIRQAGKNFAKPPNDLHAVM